MALSDKSLFLYNFQITVNQRTIDFRTVALGPIHTATLNLGYYSLTSLLTEITRAMSVADPNFTYTATADRTISSGTQNRVTIGTSSTYLDLLFLTGPTFASSIASLIGFSNVDQTGSTSYQGTSTAGTALITTMAGYTYLSTDHMREVFGTVNISASGKKEAIVFQVQRFLSVEFKYEPSTKVTNEWAPLFNWMIQQRLFDFTPNITSPTVFYECTLEMAMGGGKGLGYQLKEMLPQFPNLYQTGPLKFRQNVPPAGFI